MALIGYDNFDNSEWINLKQDPIRFLPDELVLEVFSCLNLASLGAICSVCKEWKRLSQDPILWKIAIYREIAFGNDKWARCFGKDAVKDEDQREEFSSLPWMNFIEDCKKFQSLFPEKKAKDCLMLVRLPKTLKGGFTLKNLGRLVVKYSYNNIGLDIWTGVADELGDKPIDKSRWVLMTKDILPESRNKSYGEQQKIIAGLVEKFLRGYEVPEALDATACILAHYFDSKVHLFNDKPWTYTRCKDKVQGVQISVGGFQRDCLSVIADGDNQDYNCDGVAVLRKF
jgi:hypothetical protein